MELSIDIRTYQNITLNSICDSFNTIQHMVVAYVW